jgi:hypothetical protein
MSTQQPHQSMSQGTGPPGTSTADMSVLPQGFLHDSCYTLLRAAVWREVKPLLLKSNGAPHSSSCGAVAAGYMSVTMCDRHIMNTSTAQSIIHQAGMSQLLACISNTGRKP